MTTTSVPLELWLEIFHRLDYHDLKRCMGVSKHFRAILLGSPSLDRILFRGSLPANPALITFAELELHPLFNHLCYGCSNNIDDVLLFLPPTATEKFPAMTLKQCTASKEHATSPPVTKMTIKHASYPVSKTTNKHGVTVLQVMQTICRHFGTKVGRGIRLSHLEYYDDIEPGSKEDRVATREDLLGDHRAWNGLSKYQARINSDGSVQLTIGSFDS